MSPSYSTDYQENFVVQLPYFIAQVFLVILNSRRLLAEVFETLTHGNILDYALCVFFKSFVILH